MASTNRLITSNARQVFLLAALAFVLSSSRAASAQPSVPDAGIVDQAASQTAGATVTCASKTGARTECAANTSAGVALLKSMGPNACILGKTWGYGDTSVWVADGCSAEFTLGPDGLATSVTLTFYDKTGLGTFTR